MKLFQGYQLLIILSLTANSIVVANYAKLGCNDKCGKVRIPYPFGIGANCSVNKWYTVDCNSSTPYLSALNHLEVLHVNLENQLVTVNVSTISNCRTPVINSSLTMSLDLGKSPFLFSQLQNKFVFQGCGNAVIMDHGSAISGCSTNCHNNGIVSDKSNCLGITCCQTTIPHYLKLYTMNLMVTGSEDGACGSAFLVDENSYGKGRFSSQYVPVSLLWTLQADDFNQEPCFTRQARLEVNLGNGTTMESWKCVRKSSLSYEGNPYLSNGYKVTKECSTCADSGGYCDYEGTYDIAGTVTKRNFTCGRRYPFESKSGKTSLGVILGISISMGLLFLVATSYVMYKFIKKTKDAKQRKKFFKRNGGLLLKQQEEADPSLVDKIIHFTSHELEKATDNFNENRILGQGGQGTVYKGMLVDGRIVAVKKSKILDESQLQQFINEVVILSQVNHRNVVKLLGCCLETDVPLLVSEFVSNGTLYDHIHNNPDEFPISLNMRLQIAIDVAGALAYLHSATSIPIYHRDIKTTNILLDDKYRAKLSDFGTSRLVMVDQTHLTTLVKGTFGYLDPEYFQSSQFTDKSDVYSFGVVLVELLTGERPISLTRFGENRNLATHFMLAMEEDRVMSIFDPMILKEGTMDDLLAMANLAMQCLNQNGKSRPTMKEVVIELETIRMSHVPCKVQTNFKQVMHMKDFPLTYGEPTLGFMSSDDSVSE